MYYFDNIAKYDLASRLAVGIVTACSKQTDKHERGNEMKTAAFKHWHVWEGTKGVIMSDERTKTLRQFSNIDDCVNWLYLHDQKDTARAINKSWKGN